MQIERQTTGKERNDKKTIPNSCNEFLIRNAQFFVKRDVEAVSPERLEIQNSKEAIKTEMRQQANHKYQTRNRVLIETELSIKQDEVLQRLRAQITFMSIYKRSFEGIEEYLDGEHLKHMPLPVQKPFLDNLKLLDTACLEVFEMSQSIILKCSQICDKYKPLEAFMGIEKISSARSRQKTVCKNGLDMSADSRESTDTDDLKYKQSRERSNDPIFAVTTPFAVLGNQAELEKESEPKKLQFSLALSERDAPLYLNRTQDRVANLLKSRRQHPLKDTGRMKLEPLPVTSKKSSSQTAKRSHKQNISQAQTARTVNRKRSERSSLSEEFILELDSSPQGGESHDDPLEGTPEPQLLRSGPRKYCRRIGSVPDDEKWPHLPALGYGTLVYRDWYHEMNRVYEDKEPNIWPLLKKARRTGRKACEKSDEIQIVRYLQRELAKNGKLPNANAIREMALTQAKRDDFKASKGWLDKFKARNLVLLEAWRRKRLDLSFNLLDKQMSYTVLGLPEPPSYLRKPTPDESDNSDGEGYHQRKRRKSIVVRESTKPPKANKIDSKP